MWISDLKVSLLLDSLFARYIKKAIFKSRTRSTHGPSVLTHITFCKLALGVWLKICLVDNIKLPNTKAGLYNLSEIGGSAFPTLMAHHRISEKH